MQKGSKGRLGFSERLFHLKRKVAESVVKSHPESTFLISRAKNTAAVIAELTRGWPKRVLSHEPVEKIVTKALRAKKIRRIAEVGGKTSPTLRPFERSLKEANAKLTFIEGLVRDLPESYRGNFDLILAQGVFTTSGYHYPEHASVEYLLKGQEVKDSTSEITRLVRMLSNNPNARVIITTLEDEVLVDKRLLEQHCEIVKWETDTGIIFGHREFPSLLILKKKQRTAAQP